MVSVTSGVRLVQIISSVFSQFLRPLTKPLISLIEKRVLKQFLKPSIFSRVLQTKLTSRLVDYRSSKPGFSLDQNCTRKSFISMAMMTFQTGTLYNSLICNFFRSLFFLFKNSRNITPITTTLNKKSRYSMSVVAYSIAGVIKCSNYSLCYISIIIEIPLSGLKGLFYFLIIYQELLLILKALIKLYSSYLLYQKGSYLICRLNYLIGELIQSLILLFYIEFWIIGQNYIYQIYFTFNMNLLAIIILSFLVYLVSPKKYTCVFDQLYKDYHPHTHESQKKDQALKFHMHGRQLAVVSRTPIRITLDTSDFENIKLGMNGASKTTSPHLQYIKRAMQVAQTFFERRIQVTQVNRIYAPINCFDFDTPQNDRSNGIASSDLHIYVRYVTDKGVGYGATGIHCKVFDDSTAPAVTFQAGRPTVGRIIFNTYALLEDEQITNDQALLTNRRFAAITATAIHETIHILGFNSNLYTTYLDPNSLTGDQYDESTYLSTNTPLHASRPASILLQTPNVKQWARDFFNCPSAPGMQLQNQDATTPGSHWQRVIMYDQLMTGTQLGAQKGISGVTFALLKDMGWYGVDDRFSDYTNYGYRKGCDFFNKACYDTASNPKYFCNAITMAQISYCSSNFLGKSVCTKQSALMADGCGMWAQYHHCVDPDQGDDGFKQYTLQQYKTTSFCVTSTLGTSSVSQQSKSRCYPYVCTYSPLTESIKFTVGTYTVNCLKTQAGTTKTISALAGFLECPNYDDFCVNSRKICKNWCSKNGICTRGVCNCYTGYSGEDCSKTDCTSTKYYNPADGSCGQTCPSKTYQNKYSRTCLPCSSQCDECIGQPQICSSCHSTVDKPQVFYNGLCYSKCPTGTFKVGDICNNCDTATAKCSTCSQQTTNCTSCQVGFILSEPVSGTCGTSCPNPVYSIQDRVNYKCVSTCNNNLIISADGTTPICILCPVGQFKWISDGACHINCPPAYYPDTEMRFCKECHSSCLYCDGSFAENCTKCKSDSTLKYLLLKMCVSSCPSGYYANDTSGACQVCTVTLNCAACYVNPSTIKIQCSTCKYGYFIQQNHTCLTSCDQYKYKNKWNHSCDACSDQCADCSSPYESSCINCRLNKYFLSNQTGGYCLNDCPQVLYVKTGFNCLTCHKTCKTCNGMTSSSCSSCVQGLYLYNGYCRYVCPQKTYPSSTTSICQSCNEKCKFCFGSTVNNCTSCQTNLVLNNYTCTTGCPTGMTVNQWSVCVKHGVWIESNGMLLASILILIFVTK